MYDAPQNVAITRVTNRHTGRQFDVSTILWRDKYETVAFEVGGNGMSNQYDFSFSENGPAVAYMLEANLLPSTVGYVYVGSI